MRRPPLIWFDVVLDDERPGRCDGNIQSGKAGPGKDAEGVLGKRDAGGPMRDPGPRNACARVRMRQVCSSEQGEIERFTDPPGLQIDRASHATLRGVIDLTAGTTDAQERTEHAYIAAIVDDPHPQRVHRARIQGRELRMLLDTLLDQATFPVLSQNISEAIECPWLFAEGPVELKPARVRTHIEGKYTTPAMTFDRLEEYALPDNG